MDGDYLRDRTFTGERSRKSHVYYKSHQPRDWTNSIKDRLNGGHRYFGPGWMLPKVVATVTASIVWGVCGKMADMPEY
jgi:hypothetical protein